MKKSQNPRWFPSVKITLPITGIVVEFSEYLTTGESRQLQRLLLRTDIPLSQIKTDAISGSKAEGFIDMQDRALEYLFRSANKMEGEIGQPIDIPNTLEFVSSLPMEDGNAIYEKVGDIMGGSRLDKDAKKN